MPPPSPTRRTTLKTFAALGLSSALGLGSLSTDATAQSRGSSSSASSGPPALAWNHHYTTDDGYLGTGSWSERGRSAVQTSDGGFVVGTDGRTADEMGSESEQQFFALVKADNAGEQQWTSFVDDGRDNTEQFLHDLTEADDGGIVIVGRAAKDRADGPDPFGGKGRAAEIVKTDAGGDREWVRVYDPPLADQESGGPLFDAVSPTDDGGFVVGGLKRAQGWLLKVGADGRREWERLFTYDPDAAVHSPPYNAIHDVVQTGDGGYGLVLAGGTVIRTDADGSEAWRTEVRTVDDLSGIVQTADGGFAVTGDDSAEGPDGNGDDNDFVLVKLAADGSLEWDREYQGPAGRIDDPVSVVATGDGGYAIAGTMERYADENPPLTFLKTDAVGNETWRRHVDETGQGVAGQALLETSDGGLAATHPGPSLAKLSPLDGQATPKGETGTIEIRAGWDDVWRTVELQRSYENPVVIARPPSFRGGQPVHTRVRRVTGTSFECKLEEWLYLDGAHYRERVSYLVLEAGRYQLDNGLAVDVGTTRTDEQWTRTSFSSAFRNAPVVLSQPQTFEGGEPVVSRTHNVTASGFGVRLEEEQARGAHRPETIGYVALTPGVSSSETVDRFGTASTYAGVDHTWTDVPFPVSYDDPPVFLAEMQTANGLDRAQLRVRDLTGDGATVKVEEERSADDEVRHAPETVGFLTLKGERTIDGY